MADTYTIGLTLSDFDLEGELSLVLKKNGEKVYLLSFAIVPGSSIQLEAGQVLLISRVQGAKNQEMIRAVTKAFGEVCPPAMLLTAARAIAVASGIECLAGVGSAMQVVVGEKAGDQRSHFFDYDGFWHSKGGTRLENGLFHLSLFPHCKPVESIKSKHRTRTLRKRQFDDELLEKCRTMFDRRCLKEISKSSILSQTATLLIALVSRCFLLADAVSV